MISGCVKLGALILLGSIPTGIGIKMFSSGVNGELRRTRFGSFYHRCPGIAVSLRASKKVFRSECVIVSCRATSRRVCRYNTSSGSKNGGIAAVATIASKTVCRPIVSRLIRGPMLALEWSRFRAGRVSCLAFHFFHL